MTDPNTITLRIGPAEVAIDARDHAELTNWAAWQQARQAGGGRRAGSAEGRVIDLAHQVPHLLPGVHMLAPGQRFIANAQATAPSAFGQQAQVIE